MPSMPIVPILPILPKAGARSLMLVHRVLKNHGANLCSAIGRRRRRQGRRRLILRCSTETGTPQSGDDTSSNRSISKVKTLGPAPRGRKPKYNPSFRERPPPRPCALAAAPAAPARCFPGPDKPHLPAGCWGRLVIKTARLPSPMRWQDDRQEGYQSGSDMKDSAAPKKAPSPEPMWSFRRKRTSRLLLQHFGRCMCLCYGAALRSQKRHPSQLQKEAERVEESSEGGGRSITDCDCLAGITVLVRPAHFMRLANIH